MALNRHQNYNWTRAFVDRIAGGWGPHFHWRVPDVFGDPGFPFYLDMGIYVWTGYLNLIHESSSHMNMAMIRKNNTVKACCYGNKCFSAIDPCNHHTKFEICLIHCWFYKIPRSEQFSHQVLIKECSFSNNTGHSHSWKPFDHHHW